jgi:hypothetical protein
MGLRFRESVTSKNNNIMKLQLFLLILICSVHINAQEIERYDGKLIMSKDKRSYHVNMEVHFIELQETDTVKLFIHQSANIENITSDGEEIDYKITPEQLIGEDKLLNIPTRNMADQIIELAYAISLDSIKNPDFKYRPEWNELNIYTAWFPFNVDYGLFNYKLAVQTNAVVVSSTQLVNGSIENHKPTFDIPLVISDSIESTTAGDGAIRLFHYEIEDSILAGITRKSQDYYDSYTKQFGESESTNLSIAINNFNRNIAYARPQFISMSLNNDFTKSNQKTLAHEIAHLWWNKADLGTWEDWLNEAFAEYSALITVRNDHGLEAFESRIAGLEKRVQDLPAIMHIDKKDPASNTVLTYKGAYFLNKLENRLGEKEFVNLLKLTHRAKIKDTEGFLKLLQKRFGKDHEEWFAALLEI